MSPRLQCSRCYTGRLLPFESRPDFVSSFRACGFLAICLDRLRLRVPRTISAFGLTTQAALSTMSA